MKLMIFVYENGVSNKGTYTCEARYVVNLKQGRILVKALMVRASGGGLPGVNASEPHFILSNHDSSFPFHSH